MTSNQAASYVFAQSVAALAEIQSMIAANQMREMQGKTIAYGEEQFLDIPERYGLHHNGIISLYQTSEP